MARKLDLVKEAQKLPYTLKRDYLLGLAETDMHKLLASLIDKLGDEYSAEITHGRDEYGRDLVVREKDRLGNQYIGVIVKMGDKKGQLTGETGGVIDNIISQARQAMSHPCLLRELEAGSVQINQLWIFFVGRLTHAASARIQHEIKDTSKRLFALEPTVDLFSKNYPEVFFNAALAEFVENALSKLEDISLAGDTKLRKRVFVSPWISKWETASDITDLVAAVSHSPRMPFQKLSEVACSGGKIILTGDPGVGKTTALIKIASDMLRENFMLRSKDSTKSNLGVPMLVKAKDIGGKTPEELYAEFITVPELESLLSITTLLVDGLDEISPDKRNECLENAVRFADKFNCGLVLTCRKIPMIMSVLNPFDRYELLPLEYSQAMTLVELSVKDKTLIKILQEGIQRDELKIDLTPLAIEMLIEVASYEKEVPASLVEILERYTDMNCGKYDKGKGIESIFEHHIKKKFLGELAWKEFFLKDTLEITKEAFDIFVRSYGKQHSWVEDKFQQFVTEIERSGLLRIGDFVSFWHRSFLDFFVAFRISEERLTYPTLSKDIANIYFHDMWTDVAFYYVGIQRVISPEIVSDIDEYPLDDFDVCIYKVLIGRLLQAGWLTTSNDKIVAIKMGLRHIEQVREYVDEMLASSGKRLPAIFSDHFYMSIIEYAYGSRTLLAETNTICTTLESEHDLTSFRSCLLLLWAQRSRLTIESKSQRIGPMLATLAALEMKGELSVRDKLVSLLMMEQIENEDKALLKSIRRKIGRTKELHPAEMRRLLPSHKGNITFSFKRTKRRDR